MNKEELIGQLLIENDQLKREIEFLKVRIAELESRLARYENAHTPLSLRRGGKCKKDLKEGSKGKPGQKEGHQGVARPPAKPDKQVHFTRDQCPDCGTKLGEPFRIESKIVEGLPEPQPAIVTEYKSFIGKISNGF